jgi:hypothetical protein
MLSTAGGEAAFTGGGVASESAVDDWEKALLE